MSRLHIDGEMCFFRVPEICNALPNDPKGIRGLKLSQALLRPNDTISGALSLASKHRAVKLQHPQVATFAAQRTCWVGRLKLICPHYRRLCYNIGWATNDTRRGQAYPWTMHG